MKLIVAIDGEKSAKTALNYILDKKPARNTEMHLMHVIAPGFADARYVGLPDVVEEERQEEQFVLSDMAKILDEKLNIKATVEILEGYTPDTIAAACKKYGADEVIVASHGRHGLSRFFNGSIADEIVDAAPCTVVVLKMAKDGSLVAH